MRLLKKALKIGGAALLVLLALLLVTGAYLYSRARDQVYAEYTGNPPSVLQYYDEAAPEPRPPAVELEPSRDLFEPALFGEPDNRFGPWTRWWWPGNDVEPEELRREIRMFAEHGFGGVEIQPFTCGLDPKAPTTEQNRVFSYDTEAYFENLRVVMRAAREAGIGAELRHSSDLGTYTAGFTLEEPDPDQRYLVDLGSVHFTADVRVNGQDAGTLLFSPYRLDVTDHLVAGENQIEVTVTPAPRNGFIGRALAGERPYERLRNQADRLMSAGLAGPVRLLTLDVEG